MTFAIKLTQQRVTIIDAVDREFMELKWCASKNGKTFYALRACRRDGKKTTEYLHKVIAAEMGIVGDVDHVDGNGLNNRRSNLRAATHQQNMANQALRVDNDTGVKGVSRMGRKFRARIQVNGVGRHLGLFDNIDDARAKVEAERLLAFGPFANHGTRDTAVSAFLEEFEVYGDVIPGRSAKRG